jgi:hypothetical protein
MWAIDVSTFDPYLELASSTAASDRIAPYLGMLDGGQDGVLYNDLVDYFYYFQLRRQGEDAIESRIITGMWASIHSYYSPYILGRFDRC